MLMCGGGYRELDVLLLGTVFPPYCSVTAKNSLKRVPVLGWFSEMFFYKAMYSHPSTCH